MTDLPEGLILRETIVATDGEMITTDEYPWVEAARVVIRGGDATEPDGTPGENGYALVELYGKPEEGL